MAYIGHLCSCGCMDVSHTPIDLTHPRAARNCQNNARPECRQTCTMPLEPIMRPTFDLKRQEVERIVPPGDRLGGPNGFGVSTCDCPACQALYGELSDQAA